MTLNSGAVLDALITMLGTTTGVQRVYRGAPESLDHTLCAWAALGGHTIDSEEFEVASPQLARSARFFVAFAYRVVGSEGTAEDALADAVDAFEYQFYLDRLSRSGIFAFNTTSVEDGALDVGIADAPEYAIYAGQENRIYPVLVTVLQRQVE